MAEPPTMAEIEFLDGDLKKWVPNFPDLFKGKKVLDLGAGRGMLGGLVAERYAPRLAVSLDLGFHRLRCERLGGQAAELRGDLRRRIHAAVS